MNLAILTMDRHSRLLVLMCLFALTLNSVAQEEAWTWKDRSGETKTRAELDKILADHKVWVESGGKSGLKADLSYANLSDANLFRADLRRANLSDANLSDANLSNAILRRANLFRADLRRANLSDANLSDANLSNAILRRANLFRADLRRAILSNAILSNADLRGADLRGANLSNAILSDANLFRANLSYANLSNAILSGANLSNAILSGANLRGADLSNAILSGANLSNANLRGADLFNANLRRANLFKANLSDASLVDASLVGGADLSGAILSNAILSGANLRGADLSDANLRGANLSNAILSGANLRGADLSDANLFKADLSDANLSDANLRGADLNGANYEPSNPPLIESIALAMNLDRLIYGDCSSPIMATLKRALKDADYYTQHRQVIAAIRRHDASLFDTLMFDWTCELGANPTRPLWIVAGTWLLCTVFYWLLLHRRKGSGLYLLATGKKINTGNERVFVQRLRYRHPPRNIWYKHMFRVLRRQGHSLGTAVLFSLMSAFNIGFRELNFGRWIRMLQPREFDIKAHGIARVISGTQSLLSIYLVALAVLSYFGTPFDR